jgi:hypothetical protein
MNKTGGVMKRIADLIILMVIVLMLIACSELFSSEPPKSGELGRFKIVTDQGMTFVLDTVEGSVWRSIGGEPYFLRINFGKRSGGAHSALADIKLQRTEDSTQ